MYEVHGVAHGKTVPLLPILELFRSYFAILAARMEQIADPGKTLLTGAY